MVLRIGGTHTSTVQLTKAGQNPVTVLSGAEIATPEGYAIFGRSLQSWTVINDGALSSALDAIRLTAGGTITNGSSGDVTASISGVSAGIYISGGSGSVVNLATVTAGMSAASNVGVKLTGGGSVTNGSISDPTATIQGSNGVYISGGAGTLTNYGHILGGVGLYSTGGSIDNVGTIAGSIAGYVYRQGSFSVTNHGVILGSVYAHFGYNSFNGSASLDNLGTFTGSVSLAGYNSSINMTNPGTITGSVSLSGIYTDLTLANSGVVVGAVSIYGESSVIPSTLTNTGTISNPGGTAVSLGGSGGYPLGADAIVNGSPTATRASISGAVGALLSAVNKQSVTNYGTITGTGGTAISFQYSDDWLKIGPSAVFVGKVEGFGGALGNGIELASAAGVGVISGIGSQFIDFGNVAVDPGARWRLAGANSLVTSGTVSLASGGALIVAGSLVAGPALTLAGGGALGVGASGVVEVGTAGGARMGRITVDPGATVIGSGRLFGAMTDAGTIEAQGGRLSLGGAVAGRGTAAIDTGATLLALNNLKTSSIQFLAGASESLLLNRPTMVTGRISGFNAAGSGDRIELLGFEVTGSAFSANTLTLSGAGGAAMLRFAGSYSLANFHMSSDHHNGTNITFV